VREVKAGRGFGILLCSASCRQGVFAWALDFAPFLRRVFLLMATRFGAGLPGSLSIFLTVSATHLNYLLESLSLIERIGLKSIADNPAV